MYGGKKIIGGRKRLHGIGIRRAYFSETLGHEDISIRSMLPTMVVAV
jgi:hypothetical protein